MIKVSVDDYIAACDEWNRSRKSQRLGQYLMNTLCPQEVNPTIFYETDPSLAGNLFFKEYVE